MHKNILIVVSKYYQDVSNNLLKGVEDYFKELNKKKDSEFIINSFHIVEAPGCFEVPYLINKFNKPYQGFIALGCIIRGETYHFELISNEVTRKIMDLSISLNKPIGFGILTCENLKQAIERSDTKKGNKGREAAKACVSLLKQDR